MHMIDACRRPFDDSRRNSEGRFGRSGADSDGEPNMRPRNSIAATTASTEDGDREVRWECSTGDGATSREVEPLLRRRSCISLLRCTSSKRRRHADRRRQTPTPLKMPASTEEERSRTLEIEDPSTPAPEIAERPATLANKAAAAASKLRPKTHTRVVRGEFGVVVGASSRDARLECTVAV